MTDDYTNTLEKLNDKLQSMEDFIPTPQDSPDGKLRVTEQTNTTLIILEMSPTPDNKVKTFANSHWTGWNDYQKTGNRHFFAYLPPMRDRPPREDFTSDAKSFNADKLRTKKEILNSIVDAWSEYQNALESMVKGNTQAIREEAEKRADLAYKLYTELRKYAEGRDDFTPDKYTTVLGGLNKKLSDMTDDGELNPAGEIELKNRAESMLSSLNSIIKHGGDKYDLGNLEHEFRSVKHLLKKKFG